MRTNSEPAGRDRTFVLLWVIADELGHGWIIDCMPGAQFFGITPKLKPTRATLFSVRKGARRARTDSNSISLRSSRSGLLGDCSPIPRVC
jgi:hypothetical protein